MDILEVLQSIENTDIASSIRNSLYLFPMLESFHVIGLALVFGSVAVMDFRMLGLASTHRPFKKVTSDTLKWIWLAFVITLVTGAFMFTTNAVVYYHNPVFRWKMALLLVAGINMGIFELTTGRSAHRWGMDRSAPAAGKVAAVISLTLWITIIFLGRWIGFTIARSSVNEEPPPQINIEDLFPGAGDDAPVPAPPTPANEKNQQ